MCADAMLPNLYRWLAAGDSAQLHPYSFDYSPGPPLKATCTKRHRCADAMLRNLYRWLAGGDSALAAPPLLAAVRSAMRKVMLQLVAEAGKLGATVVAADFATVIVATGKHDLPSAVGCVSLLFLLLQGLNQSRRCYSKRPVPCLPGIAADVATAIVATGKHDRLSAVGRVRGGSPGRCAPCTDSLHSLLALMRRLLPV